MLLHSFVRATVAMSVAYGAYLMFCVPALEGMRSIPVWVWVVSATPIGIACVWSGCVSRSGQGLLFAIIGGGLGLVFAECVLAMVNAPGLKKSVLFDEPQHVLLPHAFAAVAISALFSSFGFLIRSRR
jgi:hypothetical protein